MHFEVYKVFCICLIVENGHIINGVDSLHTVRSVEESYWTWRMKESPEFSTYLGYYENNDILRSYKVEDFEKRKNDVQELLNQLSTIDPNSLTSSVRVDFLIMKDTLETFLAGYDFAMFGALNPVNNLEGIHIYYSATMASSRTRGDYENYIARLEKVPNQIDEIISSFREAIALNRTYHRVSINKVESDIGKLLVDAEISDFFIGVNYSLSGLDTINGNDKESIRSRTLLAANKTIEAYRTLRQFIINEYIPKTRPGLGVNTMANGSNYYRACLKWHLSFDMTPEEVHNIGIREVERIHTEMVQIIRRKGFSGTVKQFFDTLKNDSRFVFNNASTILSMYEDIVRNRINPKLPDYFENIPDIPLEIREMTYDGPGGGYSSASETSPGIFWINLFRPWENPAFDFMSLSLHEASPGHHLQHSYAMEAALPDYRRQTEISFYDVPFWHPFYSAYSEGWALYSEYLGVEMGLYQDDYEMLGRYSGEILRACRLVVDTGLHYYNWEREKAVEYMLNYTAYSREATEIEVDRYVTWPGQACAYKLGEIKIKDLRKKAEERLGSKFNIKKFHSVILVNGAVPMSILETLVDEWIEESLVASTSSRLIPHPVALILLSIFYFLS